MSCALTPRKNVQRKFAGSAYEVDASRARKREWKHAALAIEAHRAPGKSRALHHRFESRWSLLPEQA